ncbi:L,D-transpeptidase family protein [soil metagenome]
MLVVVALILGLIGAGSTPAEAAVPKKRVTEVQRNLKRLGIWVTVDGVEGPRTRQAVCAARRLLRYKKVSRNRITWTDIRNLRRADALPKPRNGKTYLSVDKTCQMMYEAKRGKWIRIVRVSTGARGHRTPSGEFKITWRWPGWHDSSEYPSDSGNGNMFNAMYFKAGGYAVHGSRSVPAHPASHGCVRVKVRVAKKLYKSVANGTRVHIYGSY